MKSPMRPVNIFRNTKRQMTSVRVCFRDPFVTVGTKSQSVKHTLHLEEVSGISLHFANGPLLVFVILWQKQGQDMCK